MTKSRPTNVGDGSRTDARGGDSRGELVAAIDSAQREYDAAVAEVAGCQSRLATLNGRVRGQQVANSVYASVCREQAEVKQRIVELQTEMAEKKRRLKAMNEDLYAFDRSQTARASRNEMADVLKLILTEMRAIRRHLEGDVG